MKQRFAEFLVEKSKIILISFIFLALICAALIPRVTVNQDMTRYLPKDSSMRQGLDLMRAEFGNENASELQVMFGDLKTQKEKNRIKAELEAIPGAASVDYEADSKDYNRGAYTLYIIHCDHKSYSRTAAGIRKEVKDRYEDTHQIALGGAIQSSNESGLPLWIAITAVALVFLILLIMANSWIEPLAFLITIAIAVLINMGTYIFYPSISKTTFGIVAVLQLALSMDYSIMLLNRYRQQRQRMPDKKSAMKEALALSFGAISGSSLTTFAGLLALVFMSFTVGADVGLALAKGVIASLICIFTVLPALLLGFDDLMLRTAKKTLPFDLPRLSRAQFRLRLPLTLFFVCMLGAGLFVRSGVDFSYAQYESNSPIDKVFGYNNSIVMLYDEKDGASAGALSAKLDDHAPVKSAVCYESTIGKKRTAEDMKTFIDDMRDESDNGSFSAFGSSDADFSDTATGDRSLTVDTLRLIYYDYFVRDPEFTMTIPQFTAYLKDDVMEDPDFQEAIDQEMRDQVSDLSRFTDVAALTSRKGAAGLANFFDMKKKQARQLLLYYQIKKGNDSGGKMTLPTLIAFLVNDVAGDPDYGSMMDGEAVDQLKALRPFTDKDMITEPMGVDQAAQALGMDEAQMRLVYVLARAKAGPDSVLTIGDLAAALEEMAADPILSQQFGNEQTAQLIAGLKQIAAMDPSASDMVAMEQRLQGYGMPLDLQTLAMIYAWHEVAVTPEKCLLTLPQVVNFLLTEESMSGSMTDDQRQQLQLLQTIMDVSLSREKLSAKEAAGLLGMSKSDARSVYLLRKYKYGDTSGWKLTPQQFINFLANTVLKDPDMKSRVGGSADDLLTAQKLINSCVAGTQYTYGDLSDFFMDLGDSEDMDRSSVKMIYELYGSENMYDDDWRMDLTGMIHHLEGDMMERPVFGDAMDDQEKEDLHEMREDLDEAADLLRGNHYGRMIINADLPEDSDETRAFMDQLTRQASADFDGETWFIGNTPMAYEMSKTFKRELNRLTLLTALFILIIVLLTFRRLATPIILVLIIQCAVFLTMAILNLLNVDMNYLALLIVQSIMMGATIDYAIIYTTYYIENRSGIDGAGGLPPAEAIRAAFRGTLQTILTSAIILIAAVGLLSFAFSEPATRQICRILSVGCLIATLLVIFILPGILACLDRLVIRRNFGPTFPAGLLPTEPGGSRPAIPR